MLRQSACVAAAVSWLAVFPAWAQGPAAAPLGSAWEDIKKMPDLFTGAWQSRSPMVDGPVPGVQYTPQAKEYMASYKTMKDIALAGANCKNPGLPITQRSGSPLKFMFEPGMIAIYIEQSSMTRFIRLNGKHSDEPNPTFLGESIGHFEGDTLVVDTIGLREDTVFQYGVRERKPGETGMMEGSVFGPHGPNVRLVERIRLQDPETLEIKLTIYDDTVFVGPYESQPLQIFKRHRGEKGWPGEWQCETAIVNTFNTETNEQTFADPEEALRLLEEQSRAQ